ncbi:MAG: hypothetical protein M0Q40_06615 [Limnochordia bacterium]|nr:hypothetical protein [Limnochordia bacterium]
MGYSDERSFHRGYKAVFGVTPGQFGQQDRNRIPGI